MNRVTQAYRRFFSRRRRLWRYVSPRRRVAALVILATLLGVAYAYGRLTHDDRVRRHARNYLKALTGGRVEIGQAHFGLLSGVTLREVRVYVPGEPAAEPFFRAKTVLLRHRPWAALWHRTLEPQEVVCLEPVVTLEHDAQQDRYNFQGFFPRAGQSAPREITADLPPIHVRQGRLRWVDVDHGLRIPFDEMPVTLSMTAGQEGEYVITFEEQREGGQPVISGRLSLDLRTGQARVLDGTVPIPNLDKALPGKYRQWRQRYDVRGEVRLVGPEQPSAQGQAMECRLVDVSLTLPAEEGGLELAHVAGTVGFEEAGVTLRDVAGQVPAAGGSEFVLSGRYEGYEADSPFRLSASAPSVWLPDPSQAGGQLTGLLERLSRDYGLIGRCEVGAEIWREPGGTIDYRATARPQGMVATCRRVPYRLEDITGQIEITPAAVTLRGIRGRRHGASIGLEGVIVPADKPGATHLDIAGKDVLLDREFRDAMPSPVQKVWDVVDPSGRLSGAVKLTWDGKGKIDQVDAAIEFTGQTSARPREFPYPVDNLIGRATVRNRDVVVEDVRGRRGGMSCLVSGRLLDAGREEMDMDLAIEARRLPLDWELTDALPPQAREAMVSLHAAGWADRVRCRLLRNPAGTFRYEVQAAVEELSFQPEAVPCQVTGARGEIQITPGRVTLKDLTGLCNRGTVVIAGSALLGGQRLGLDLLVKAADLHMDDRLLSALPTELSDVSGRLSIAGPADIDLAVKSGQEPGPVDYRLTVLPHGMQIRHEGLALAFSGVRGTVLASPDRIELIGLSTAGGSSPARLEGVISTGPESISGDVRLVATDLPIPAGLAAAMPAEVSALMGRVGSGGVCDVDFRRLAWTRPRRSATTGSAPATASAAGGPAGQTAWELEGSVRMGGLVVDLDFGQRTLWGLLEGQVACAGGSLAVEADLSLSEIKLGPRRLSDVHARIIKPAGASMMRIDNLSAHVHGGRAAGFAEIALTEPMRYGVSLSVEDLDLHDLFYSGEGGPTTRPGFDVQGRLRGNIQMTATAGKLETRQASGVLKIAKARIDKLPVVLGFVHIIYLWLPGEETFTEGDVTYRLRGEKLIFEEISLRGPAMSLLGSGWVNMKDESLHLTFLTGPPGYLPRIAGVEGLLRGLTREIAEIRVTGTLSKPFPQTVALAGLEEAVRRLLSPEHQDEE
ncbi:MAG: AsmA-like C-terminal region-containing protein [Phycisphaerae bacterium]|nr:AsmA-like C-terminal region-containing protein [Phycisphaerae bacterium]